MRGRLLALGLVSATSLMWEVVLTRLFSVVLQYHYVFLAVSLAVLGLGLGAVLVAAARARRGEAPAEDGGRAGAPASLVYLCCGLAAAYPLAALLIASLGNVESLALYSLLAVIPFAFAGVLVSRLFTLAPAQAARLYGADLLGAGAGTAAVVALLNAWGGVGVALALGPLTALAALVLAWRPGVAGDRRPLGVALAALVLTVLLAGAGVLTPLGGLNLGAGAAAPPDKTMLRLLADPAQQARVVWTRWDAFARTDVVGTADPSSLLLFTDGGAGAAIYRFNGDLTTVAGLRDDLSYLPYRVAAATRRTPRKVLIIGPGGGYDVLLARLAGASEVTAVEINGAAVAAVRHFGAYDGHLYDLPGVKAVVGDGRNVIRRSHERYDLILLRLVYSQAAEAAGHALAESYIFTTEAFRDYVAHLAPGGYLAVTGHQALEALRAFTTGIAALQASGVTQTTAMKQVAVVMTNNNDPQQRPSLMLLKRGPMTGAEVAVVQANRALLNLYPLYVPYVAPGQFDKLANGSQTLTEFLSGGSDFAIGPTSDDRPFFFDFNLGLPDAVGTSLALAALLSAALVAAGLVARAVERAGHAARSVSRGRGPGRGPGRQAAREGREVTPRTGRFWPLVLYFALLGLAFMLAEVALIQRFILLLGQPVLALVAVLGSLLISAGLGSVASSRLVGTRAGRLVGVTGLIALLLLAALVALPAVVDALVPLALPARLLASVLILAPLGFILGMPFPSGVALARPDAAPGDVAFLWAVNAAASVVGSTLAVTVAVTWGFGAALGLAACGYLGAGLVTWLRPRPTATPAPERRVPETGVRSLASRS